MPISNADILIKLSTKSGAAGDTLASTPAASLGKYISTTEVVNNSLHNLFDVISGFENAAAEAEYRCIFVHNDHATISFDNIVMYLFDEVAGGATIAIGLDPTAASAIGSASAQAVEIANEDTAPAGVVFTSPTTYGTGINIGDIGAGECVAVWVRRTAQNSAAISNDGVTLRFQGESL